MEILMKKKFVDFFYFLLMKIAESYYGESIKKEDVPHKQFF